VQQVGDGVGQWFEQGQGAGDRHAARQQVGDREGDGEVDDGEGAGLGQAVEEGDAHQERLDQESFSSE